MTQEGSEQQVDGQALLKQAGSALQQANYPEAESLYKQALSVLEQTLGEDSPEVAVCLQSLAEMYYLSGQLPAAIPLYQRLLSIGRRVLGEAHPDVLATGFRLAMTYDSVKMPNEADEVYKWVTNSAERSLGIAHPFAQKIREAYFAFMANRAPAEDLEIKFGLTPPPPPQSDPQYDSLGLEVGNDWDDITGRTRALKKPSSYKRPTKIKNLRYGADSADEKVNTQVGMRNVWHHWRSVAIAVPFLIGFLAMTFVALSRANVDYGLIAGNKALEQLVKYGTFQSVDGITGITFEQGGFATLQNDAHRRKIPYTVLRGGFEDFKAMWASAFTRREQWYRFDKEMLVTESGNVLYPLSAPEQFIAAKLRALKQFAQRYYLKTGCYPNDARKWLNDPELNYISPFTGRVDTPSSKTLNGTLDKDYLFPDIKPTNAPNESYEFLRAGGHWRDEQRADKGKINALALFIAQRCADGFKVTEFYGRAYDRNANALTSGKPGANYVIGLRLGKDLSQEAEDHAQDTDQSTMHAPDRICVAANESTDIGLLHQGMGVLLMLLAGGFLCAWVFLESRNRINDPKRFPQPCEAGFALSIVLWLVILIIHAWP